MKVELNTEELKLLLEPAQKAQESVVVLEKEVTRLNAEVDRLRSANPTAGAFIQDHNRDAVLNALANVCTALSNGNKITAIKITRELTGLGLKEAKDVVEGTYNGPGVRRMG